MKKKNVLIQTAGILLSAAMACSPLSALAEGNEGGTPPSAPADGQQPSGSAPSGQPGGQGGQPGGGGQSSAVTSWTAAKEFSSDTEESDQTYASTGTDENAVHVSGGSVGDFQPMNINFGIIEPLDHRVRGKRNKNAEISARSLQIIDGLLSREGFSV